MKENKKEDLIICRCEEVTEREIVEALSEGCTSLRAIKRRTRAGMGLCQGRMCSRLVLQVLCRETGRSPEEFSPLTSRPPVFPLTLKDIGRGEEGEGC